MQIGQIVGITKATLNRRALSGKFSTEESDRIYRFARIVEASIKLHEENRDAAIQWINRPVLGLGNRAPAELVRTSVESDAVLEFIGRLEHGIPS